MDAPKISVVADGDRFRFDDQFATESWSRELLLAFVSAADLALHPWGEPGVVPTEPGRWYMQSREGDSEPWGDSQPVVTTGALPGSVARSPVALYGIGWSRSALAVDDLALAPECHRFRHRWTPEGPVAP